MRRAAAVLQVNERDEIERGQGAERSALPVPPKNQLNRKVFLNHDKTQQVLKVLLPTKFDRILLEESFLHAIMQLSNLMSCAARESGAKRTDKGTAGESRCRKAMGLNGHEPHDSRAA